MVRNFIFYLRRIMTAERSKFYVVAFVALLVEWFCFTETVGGMGNKWVVTMFKGVGDCAMLLILYWILPKRWSWIVVALLWLLSLFFIINIWYYRFWHEFVSPTFYRLWGNVNGDLLASVKSLIKFTDLLYLVIPAGLTIFYIRRNGRNGKNGRNGRNGKNGSDGRNGYLFRGVMIVGSLCLFVGSQLAFAVTLTHWNRDSGLREQTVGGNLRANLFKIVDSCSIYDFKSKGLSIYLVTAAKNIFNDLTVSHEIDLTANDKESLAEFLYCVPEFPDVDEFLENGGKNVIIILVESLNSDVIGRKVGDREITPFVNSLIEKEGTVSALDILPQVKDGCSNDGQLLTNTGLLPLTQGVASLTLGSHIEFPGLPKLLNPKSSVAIFGDTGQTWNQTGAYKSYGFKKIFTVKDYEAKADEKGVDGAMFEFADAVLDTIPQPFLMEFVTFSMHVPFQHKNLAIQPWLDNAGFAVNEKNYLNMTHYTDSEIRKFFANLEKRGLLSKTVVFIISDHSNGLAMDKGKVGKNIDRQDLLPMVFIAANTGLTRKVTVPAGQVNVFPTILHIMGEGRSCHSCYRGLDRSLLDSRLQSSVSTKGNVRGSASAEELIRQHRAWQVADSLQRGNYFKTH